MLHEIIIEKIEREIKHHNSYETTISNYDDLNMISLDNDKMSICKEISEYEIITDHTIEEKPEPDFGILLMISEIRGYLYYNTYTQTYKLTDKGLYYVSFLIL